MNNKEALKLIALVVLSPLILGVLLIVLAFVLLLAPIAGVIFLGYTLINTISHLLDTIDRIHKRNKNFKLKQKKNEPFIYKPLGNE